MIEKAVVLLSGGLDSATAAAIAKDEGFEIYGLTFRYGQKHGVEIESAGKVACFLAFKSARIVDLPISDLLDSALLVGGAEVPKGKKAEESRIAIPPTYVPSRNLIFLSIATAYAESIGASSIFIGANVIDYSGYPDCRPQFLRAFQEVINVGTKVGLRGEHPIHIRAPLLSMSKGEILAKARELGLDPTMTHSCYDPKQGGIPCGECDSCQIRQKAFEQEKNKEN